MTKQSATFTCRMLKLRFFYVQRLYIIAKEVMELLGNTKTNGVY